MSVSFSEISPTTRSPLVHLEVTPQSGVSTAVQRRLLIMPGLEIGTKYAGVDPDGEIFQVFSDQEAATLCGAGSPAHLAAKAALRIDPNMPLLISLLENNGTKASGTITFLSAATENGVIPVHVGSEIVYAVVESGQSAATMAEACRDAVNGNAASLTSGNPTLNQIYEITAHSAVDFTTIGAVDSNVGTVFTATGTMSSVTLTANDSLKPIKTNLPVYATFSSGTLTITAKCAGAQDNGTLIGVGIIGEVLPGGITSYVTAMSSGANAADLTSSIDAMGDDDYDFILSYSNDTADRNELATEIARRWTNAVKKYGHGFTCNYGTFAEQTTLAASNNTQHLTVFPIYNSRGTTYEIGAAMMSTAAKSLAADPARPVTTLEVNGIYGARGSSRWLDNQLESFLHNGVSTWTQTLSASNVYLGRVITCYTQDALGSPDETWLDINVNYTCMTIARELMLMINAKFSRVKLTNNGTPIEPGSNMVSPDTIEGEIIALYLDWVKRGLCEAMDTFKDELVVERDSTNPNRVNVYFPPDFVNQLMIVGIAMAFKR